MKRKTLAGLIVAVCVFSSAIFGQTVSVTGTVATLTDAQIGLTSGSDLWNIQRTATTTVTNGTLAVGNTVTVQCASADAQKAKGAGAQKKE
jgi:hypothetical protein